MEKNGKKKLPTDFAPPVMNPAMWDKVIVNADRTMCAAVTMSAAARQRMKEQGWMDAVEGKPPKFKMQQYMEGYNWGLTELEADKYDK